jgi:hypothetical protein
MELEQENYHDIDRIIALPRTTCCASVGAAASSSSITSR